MRRHLFQDVFPWAGKLRTVRIAKGGSMFCHPEDIQSELRKVFQGLARAQFSRGLPPPKFAKSAAYPLAELNAIHHFREGNGRAQLAYLTLLAESAGHPLALERLNPEAMLSAMIATFRSSDALLSALIADRVEP